MSLPPSKKVTKFHLKCVVCEKNFGSEYDSVIKAYPVYHTQKEFPNYDCEEIFYRVLLGIYRYLMQQEFSVPANMFLNEVSSLKDVTLKKEMVTWCLSLGYLQVDGLQRIDIPQVVREEFEEAFTDEALERVDERDGASDWIKNKLRALKDDLHPVPPDKIPFKHIEIKHGDSTLFDKIDTSKVVLNRDKRKGIIQR